MEAAEFWLVEGGGEASEVGGVVDADPVDESCDEVVGVAEAEVCGDAEVVGEALSDDEVPVGGV